MKIKFFLTSIPLLFCVFIFSKCSDSTTEKSTTSKTNFGGFESQIKWGEHLVMVGGCEDCHTPKKMTPKGPVLDESLKLSGHPSGMPPPDVDRKEMESKGLSVTQDLTAWVGPWGISYAANLTPDETGIGLWQESSFMIALREGKYKGMRGGRNLLPPMPWQFYEKMSDDEIKAIFAFLKSVKPIKNIVPQPEPPVTAGNTPPETESK